MSIIVNYLKLDKYKGFLSNVKILFLFIALSAAFLIQSPLHPWIREGVGCDSGVFKTIAYMMQKGCMPYKDTFDHKGPIIYFYNYVGDFFGNYTGIVYIEFLNLVVAFWFIYKICRITCIKKYSVFITIISMSLLFNYFDQGNLTEEYAIPFISYSLYVYLDYLINSYINRRRIILTGISCGAVFMLRPNMIAVWGIFCIYILLNHLYYKNFDELKRLVVFFFTGCLIIIVPIVVWLCFNNSFGDFWESYIVFNFQYASSSGVEVEERCEAIHYFLSDGVFIISILSISLQLREGKKDNTLNIIYLVCMIANFVTVIMSGRCYPHYGMILVPLVAYPICLLFADLKNNLVKTFIIIYLLVTFVINDWISIFCSIPSKYVNRTSEEYNLSGDQAAIVDFIKENSSDEDEISVYGNWDAIYILSDRSHATKYSYQYPIGEVKPGILKEYNEQLQSELPRILVVTAEHDDENINNFIITNDYRLAWTSDDLNEQKNKIYVR